MRPVRRSVFTQLGRRLRSPKSVRILFRISDHPTSTVDRTRPWMTRPLLVSGPDYYKTLRRDVIVRNQCEYLCLWDAMALPALDYMNAIFYLKAEIAGQDNARRERAAGGPMDFCVAANIVHETIMLKSGTWGDNGICSTLIHTKFSLLNGDNKNRYDRVKSLIRNSDLYGQAVIETFSRHVSLHFVKDEMRGCSCTWLESGKFQSALECHALELCISENALKNWRLLVIFPLATSPTTTTFKSLTEDLPLLNSEYQAMTAW
ncbi:hypothetical protein JRO89_XS07G0029400 [Xanthoceras sorbifolium]|uniref:Uncharacterized protein n=1 Tax=Xanthoceras sorbifolium TaxID=99658 RepID=A0ABQ8HS92_9ROSI|nr:hypothetical protein JRO89_XS07G0029400 [Xanthoceras sorbifolium]